MIREIIIDTETTGLYHQEGARVIEICAIVLEHTSLGRMWHNYLDPGIQVEAGATAVHGITNAMLDGSPKFASIADEFLEFVKGSYLIAHNAPFDQGFIEAELKRCRKRPSWLKWIDTIPMAKKKLPRVRYSLDALCKHYGISLAGRELHGATKDCKLLAQVYANLAGRRDQLALDGVHHERIHYPGGERGVLIPNDTPHPGPRPTPLPSRITPEEEGAHRAMMTELEPARLRSAEFQAVRQMLESKEEQEEVYDEPTSPEPDTKPFERPTPNYSRGKASSRSRGLRHR